MYIGREVVCLFFKISFNFQGEATKVLTIAMLYICLLYIGGIAFRSFKAFNYTKLYPF